MNTVRFWNGNKTTARQAYEHALLDACLNVTQEQFGDYSLLTNDVNYPAAEDEAKVFETGCDVLVTVAGNVKFENKPKIVIHKPLAKGLLGYRLLIVRQETLSVFQSLNTLSELQAFSIGIPATWADAELFRQNGFKVVERGTLEDIFKRLQHKEFDFIALGANEIEDVFIDYAEPLKDLSIEPTKMIYYHFPLVFYVHPSKQALAHRLEVGLADIMENGQYEALFNAHHGDVVSRLHLNKRQIFTLQNALLPADMSNMSPSLLD
jgi:ABC-type amino acid transport substrate-binding protein